VSLSINEEKTVQFAALYGLSLALKCNCSGPGGFFQRHAK